MNTLQADTALFFGRFHSLSVHLPIGFLLLAALLFFLSFIKGFSFLIKALPLALLLGALSAIASVILGFLLAEEGGYPSDNLFWHKLMGIALAVLSVCSVLLVLGYFSRGEQSLSLKKRLNIDIIESYINKQKKQLGFLMFFIVLSVSITGHLGGNLTHGANYLYVYAPDLIQDFLLDPNAEKSDLIFPEDSDSTLLFDHIIGPIIIQKCASCHDTETLKGGLNVTSFEGLLEGGETGPALEQGSPHSSELYKRVTLDPKSRKYMPPKGAGLSFGEISLLKYWIQNGLSRELAITSEELPEEIEYLLENTYGLSTKMKAHYEKTKVAAVTEEILQNIRKQGFKVSTLSDENNFLEVASIGKLTKENMEVLQTVREQITWLDLGDANVSDPWLDIIADFPNLTRLVLDNNSISDQGIQFLPKLEYLESINLYNTSVGDSTLALLSEIKSLKTIYVWQTKVTKEEVDKLMEENPKLSIDNGVDLAKKEEK